MEELSVTHLRKCMLVAVGLQDTPEVRASLARHSAAHLIAGEISYKCVFWVPLPLGHAKRTRDVSRKSVVPDAREFELRALRDGVIEEVVLNAPFKSDTPDALRDDIMKKAWERLTAHRMGQSFSGETPQIVSGELAEREFNRRAIR